MPASPADDAVRRAMRLAMFDAVFHALMIGCAETYFVAAGVHLRATPLELGLLVGLPLCLGSIGPVLTLRLLRSGISRRLITAGAALAQAAVIAVIAVLEATSRMRPGTLILAVALYHIFAMSAGTAWSSWYGQLVPASGRGRYFAKRSRLAQVAVCLSVIAAGLLLARLQGSTIGDPAAQSAQGLGFAVIFSVAALARLCSVFLLRASPELPFAGIAAPRQLFRYLSTEHGQNAGRVLLAGASLQLVTYLASPYFVPFMLEELRLTYLQYMVATVAVIAGKFVCFPLWGRTIDTHGGRQTLLLAVVATAMIPVPWIWAHGLGWVVLAQLLSGAAWSGHEISLFTVLLERSFQRTRAYVFAAQNLLNGAAQLLGATLGGLLLTSLDRRFRVVFVVSVALRITVALSFPRLVPPHRNDHSLRRRDILLRAIGFRASGGIVHRPVDTEEVNAQS